MKITIYTTPNCAQCRQTKRMFDKAEIDYDVVDLSKNPEAADMVKELGYTAAPVVITDKAHWSGFRISKIENTIKEIKAEEGHHEVKYKHGWYCMYCNVKLESTSSNPTEMFNVMNQHAKIHGGEASNEARNGD